MIKKLPLTGKHYELGYGNIIKMDTWLFMNEKGNLKQAPFEGLGKLGWVEEYRTVGIGKTTEDKAKKAQGQVQMVKESIIWMAISQKIC